MVESRMKAAREAAGDDVDIIMENHSYPDALGAVQLAKLAEKYNIMAFEEPNTPTTQTVEYIAKYSSVPIATASVCTLAGNMQSTSRRTCFSWLSPISATAAASPRSRRSPIWPMLTMWASRSTARAAR